MILSFAVNVPVIAENGAQDVPEELKTDGYSFVAENDNFKLYANMDTGDFCIYDIISGHYRFSGQPSVLDQDSEAFELNTGRIKTELVSMLAVNYVQLSTVTSTAVPLYLNSYAYCVMDGNVTVKIIKNGYRAEYYFSDIATKIPVEIVLGKTGFSATIVGKDIKTGKKFRVVSISLLPGFMAADKSYSGYVFVPSGSGALIPLNATKGDVATYSETVYGNDTALKVEEYKSEVNDIKVPVYGIKFNDTAITAIITKGDATANINADSDSFSTSFTRVYSQYVTSIIDSTTLFESNFENQRIIYGAENRKKLTDYSVKYVFLHGSKADYSGMAEVYRNYLGLKGKAEKPKLMISVYGAAEKKDSFLGIPYEKRIALTSFDEAEKITDYYNKKDIPVTMQYIGWNNNGIYNKKAASKYSPLGVLGGENGLSDFLEHSKKNGNSVYLDNDFLLIKKSGRGFSVYSDVCKSIFNTRTPIYRFMLSVYVPVNNEDPSYLLTPENVRKSTDVFSNGFKADAGLSMSGFGEKLYSDFSSDISRSDTLETFKKILSDYSSKQKIAIDGANAYTFKYASAIFTAPTTSDGNILFSESVPFIQMVLHGSVSYSAEYGNDLLDCIEYGANPYYYGIYDDAGMLIETSYNWLYGSTFDNWKKEAASVFKEYNKVYKNLYNKKIVSHNRENGVSKTVFDDGTVIYVNRSDKTVNAGGKTVKPQGYAVSGGK